MRNRPFAWLWFGSTVSAVGDALTWVELVWMVIEVGGTPAAVGGLVVAVIGRGITLTVAAMTVVMAVPGVLGLFTPALADENTRMPEPVPAA